MQRLMEAAAIIIPARYGSTRFPGKPLALLAGKPMLAHVVGVAQEAAKQAGNVALCVATDDERIIKLAESLGVKAAMTPPECLTGTDRVFCAAKAAFDAKNLPEIIINYQGDAPLVPPVYLVNLIAALRKRPDMPVATPAVQLTWENLDTLRKNKQTTPFSGTTVVMDEHGKALWFSKQIIPAIRKEDRSQPLSPVWRHIGLYGYRYDFLSQYVTWPEGHYEKLEGLEQLRILERGIAMQVVPVEGDGNELGVDTQEDLARAEAILKNG